MVKIFCQLKSPVVLEELKRSDIKKCAYEQRVMQISGTQLLHFNHMYFIPDQRSRGTPATILCYKRLASLLSSKLQLILRQTMSWLRSSPFFSLLHASVLGTRGVRSSCGHTFKSSILSLDLVAHKSTLPTLNCN